MAIFHCKRVNLVYGVIFDAKGGIRDRRNFDLSDFELHGTECSQSQYHKSMALSITDISCKQDTPNHETVIEKGVNISHL